MRVITGDVFEPYRNRKKYFESNNALTSGRELSKLIA